MPARPLALAGLTVLALTAPFLVPDLTFLVNMVLAAIIVGRHVIAAARDGLGRLGGLRHGVAELWGSLVAGGRAMVGIGVAVAAAGIIVGSVTMGPGQLITEAVDTLAPLVWRHVRAGGRLPDGAERFAAFFSVS